MSEVTGRNKIRLAIIGLGGFAAVHHKAVLELERAGRCQLTATCDPFPDSFMAAREELRFAERGVAVYDDYLRLLDAHAAELDMVIVPTPVPLHAAMHRACVERGLAVYLEKPPTLDCAEMEAMLAVESTAGRETNVGFNFTIEKERRLLKRRLLQGEFGRLEKVVFYGLWPRPASYFRRAVWAGKLLLDGRHVLDSCMGNALAHYIHNTLLWAGEAGVLDWAAPLQVEAELYRANEIESADTFFVRGRLAGDAELQLALTHACAGQPRHEERLECERAVIVYHTFDKYSIAWKDGRREEAPIERIGLTGRNLAHYFDYLEGREDRPLNRLADCRPFVDLYDLTLIAAGRITTLPENYLERVPSSDGREDYTAIRDIDAIFDRFLSYGLFPSRQGLSWARPGGQAGPERLTELPAVIAGMVREGKTKKRLE